MTSGPLFMGNMVIITYDIAYLRESRAAASHERACSV